MQNILDNTSETMDKSKTGLFTVLTLGYLGIFVWVNMSETNDPSMIESLDPIFLLGMQALVSCIIFLVLPFLFWRYGLQQTFNQTFRSISPLQVGYVFLIAISAMMVISVVGEWNLKLDLPDSAFEQWAQAKEAELKTLTEHIIDFQGVGHFIASIFIIAMIPAIGEELIFRGILQNLLSKLSNNSHIGIWVSAILFSAIHLQFYGFFPRMLLGALFGYLYLWSGKLSIAMLAHFFNNALALIMVYMAGEGIIEAQPEQLEEAAPWSAVVISLAIGAFLLYGFKKRFHEQLAESV